MCRLTADAHEAVQSVLVHKKDITLLGLVAPNLQGTHAAIGGVNLAQFELSAIPSILYDLGESVGKTTGTDIVDEGDGILVAQSHAGVDDHLRPSLHLGVPTLDTGEI